MFFALAIGGRNRSAFTLPPVAFSALGLVERVRKLEFPTVAETASEPPPVPSVVDVPNETEEDVGTEAEAAEPEAEAEVASKVQTDVEAGDKGRAPREEGNSPAKRPVFAKEIK